MYLKKFSTSLFLPLKENTVHPVEHFKAVVDGRVRGDIYHRPGLRDGERCYSRRRLRHHCHLPPLLPPLARYDSSSNAVRRYDVTIAGT